MYAVSAMRFVIIWRRAIYFDYYTNIFQLFVDDADGSSAGEQHRRPPLGRPCTASRRSRRLGLSAATTFPRAGAFLGGRRHRLLRWLHRDAVSSRNINAFLENDERTPSTHNQKRSNKNQQLSVTLIFTESEDTPWSSNSDSYSEISSNSSIGSLRVSNAISKRSSVGFHRMLVLEFNSLLFTPSPPPPSPPPMSSPRTVVVPRYGVVNVQS